MGTLSIWHWFVILLLPLLLAASIVLVLRLVRRVSFLEAWVVRFLSRRFEIGPERLDAQADHLQRSKLWWLPLPFSLIAPIALLMLSMLAAISLVELAAIEQASEVASLRESIETLETTEKVIWYILISLCIASGIVIHFYGGHRTLKYEFIVAGTSLLSVAFFMITAKFITFATRPASPWFYVQSDRPEIDPIVGIWVLAGYALLLTGARILPALFIRSSIMVGDDRRPSPALRRVFAYVRKSGFAFALLAVLGITQPLLTAYLVLRYVVGQRMASAPILYLRSFHYAEGPTAFGRIVAPVASRYGVLRALVHEMQGPLKLHALTKLTERAEFTTASAETWREWIASQFSKASLIIFDRSISTEGLTWELNEAVKHVDAQRVILLSKKGLSAEIPVDLFVIEYEFGGSGEKLAREQLEARLQNIFNVADTTTAVPAIHADGVGDGERTLKRIVRG